MSDDQTVHESRDKDQQTPEEKQEIQELLKKLTNLLQTTPRSYNTIRKYAIEYLNRGGVIPDDIRLSLWMSLLEVDNREEPDVAMHIQNKLAIQDEQFEKVLNADVERTFNTYEPEEQEKLRNQLRILITCYCVKFDVSYWQGMHDIVSVFLLFKPQPSIQVIFKLFSSFLQRFLPYVFDDSDCIFLQHIFKYIDLLIQYHDPDLSRVMMLYNTYADLYTPSWLLTLWSHYLEFEDLVHIWDYYIVSNSPVAHIFCIVAYVIQNREKIMNSKDTEFPRILTHLPPPDRSYLFQEIKQLINNTPSSFIATLSDIILGKTPASKESLVQLKSSLCLYITPQELLTSCFRESQYSNSSIKHSLLNKTQNYIRYMIIDIRSEEDYIYNHIKGSKLLSASLFDNIDRLLVELPKEYNIKYKNHIVLITKNIQHNRIASRLYRVNSKSILSLASQSEVFNASIESNDELLLLQQFTCLFFQRGYHYVSYCDGGYKAIKELCLQLPKEQYQYLFVGTEKNDPNERSLFQQLGLVSLMDEIFGSSFSEPKWKEDQFKQTLDKSLTPPSKPLPYSNVTTTITINNNRKDSDHKEDQVNEDTNKSTLSLFHPTNSRLINYQRFHEFPQFQGKIFICKKIERVKEGDTYQYELRDSKILLITNQYILLLNQKKSSEPGYAYIEDSILYKNIIKLSQGTNIIMFDVKISKGDESSSQPQSPPAPNNSNPSHRLILLYFEHRDECYNQIKALAKLS